MAAGQVSGSYKQKSEDSNTQASNKFGGHHGKTSDDKWQGKASTQKPVDKGNVS